MFDMEIPKFDPTIPPPGYVQNRAIAPPPGYIQNRPTKRPHTPEGPPPNDNQNNIVQGRGHCVDRVLVLKTITDEILRMHELKNNNALVCAAISDMCLPKTQLLQNVLTKELQGLDRGTIDDKTIDDLLDRCWKVVQISKLLEVVNATLAGLPVPMNDMNNNQPNGSPPAGTCTSTTIMEPLTSADDEADVPKIDLTETDSVDVPEIDLTDPDESDIDIDGLELAESDPPEPSSSMTDDEDTNINVPFKLYIFGSYAKKRNSSTQD